MGAPIITGFSSQLVDTNSIVDLNKQARAYQDSLKEPEDRGFFTDLFAAFGQGYATGQSVDEAFDNRTYHCTKRTSYKYHG